MPEYRKKTAVVEAFQLGVDDVPEWAKTGNLIIWDNRTTDGIWYAKLRTLEGYVAAGRGDYVIRKPYGELYPCKEDVFEKTYEPA